MCIAASCSLLYCIFTVQVYSSQLSCTIQQLYSTQCIVASCSEVYCKLTLQVYSSQIPAYVEGMARLVGHGNLTHTLGLFNTKYMERVFDGYLN